ncbi:Reticulon-domain-containing protein [Pilobolus umbonatus]|nr:Reticulon-domain-containing protein [Pilobolus umbonatus]
MATIAPSIVPDNHTNSPASVPTPVNKADAVVPTVIDTPPASHKHSTTTTSSTTTTVNGTPVTVTKTTSSSDSIPVVTKTTNSKNFVYKSRNVKFEEDPSDYLKVSAESLIYWEHPKKSGIVFGGCMTVLILTQYYSLLQLIAGVFTLSTGINWIFVNTHKQGQRFLSGKPADKLTNPHSARLANKETYIARDRVLHVTRLFLDVVEEITQQITKLVLIEDNWRSAVSLVISYMVWTLAKFVSTKYLLGVFVVSAFTFPRLYLQNQDLVDAHVARQSKQARIVIDKYGQIVNEKAKEVMVQVSGMIKKKTVTETEKKAN